jgi:RimJ/RimL family protein N-acetyltransferase
VKPYGVRQRYAAVTAFPPGSGFRALRDAFQALLEDRLALLPAYPFATSLRFNGSALHRYPPGRLGISPHRDSARSVNLIAVFVLEGKWRFFVCRDRDGRDAVDLPNAPGDLAAAHIERTSDDVAEFAFSVDRERRGRGVGSELFDRAVLWARNRGIRRAIVYCLNENQAMRHIARKAGGQMTVSAGETEGRLELLPATPLSLLVEQASECSAWLGVLLKVIGWCWFSPALRTAGPAAT